MAFNVYTGYGRIIGVNNGTTGEGDKESYYLRVSVNVQTGERKREDEDYAPSNIIQFTLWNKRAQGLEPYLLPGKNIVFSGELGVPSTYESDSGTKVSLRLHNIDKVQLTDPREENSDAKTEAAPKQEKAKSSTKKKAAVDDEDFPF